MNSCGSILKKSKSHLKTNQHTEKNPSTETTMGSIMKDVIPIRDEGKCGIPVMLDLRAAFDTVVHEYLFNDLKHVGIENHVYRWFESYLQDREVAVA